MTLHGARNIVLVSRSGGGMDAIDELEREMQRHDARIVVIKCDVTDEDQVRQLVGDCQSILPPICGVIHAAMVLRVSTACTHRVRKLTLLYRMFF